MNLPKKLPGKVCPFEFVARYIESTPLQGEQQAQAQAHCAMLRAAAKTSTFTHDDPVVLLLIGNTAINASHREAMVEIISNDEAIKLVWRLNGWKENLEGA